MPRKTEEEIKKLPVKEQYYAKDPMYEFKPENIFSKDSIKHINLCILGNEENEKILKNIGHKLKQISKMKKKELN